MINEFKTTLQDFIGNKCELSTVIEALNELLKKHPQLASDIDAQLQQLLDNKHISADAFQAMHQVTSEYADSGDAEQTVLSADQGPASDEEATELNPHLHEQTQILSDSAPTTTEVGAADEEATELNPNVSQGAADNEATELNPNIPHDDEATLVTSDEDEATLVAGDEATDGFDMDLDMDTGPTTGTTGPTIGPDGMPVMSHGDEVIDVGSVLRNRFELKAKLGEGGMGAVFMAIDKIKEEAQDKNPKVAVKVLNETFKQFRESFIALQRESSKQQRLAHPNIATVFDFDRDYTYGTVFMTMEMLEGEPLDKFIRRIPTGGLSYEEAKPIIDGMCEGLAYAHQHQLVHSDFKPGNCFINTQGTLKLLDFGIARAAKPKNLEGDGEKETTLFDPGSLGALTPAYASTEMLEGETPDPTDDIYALAVVTYQLLSGKHPFNKMPANQARDNKLVPAPIKKLNRRQNRGLLRGLAFSRDKRTPTVEQFHDEITPQSPVAKIIAGSILVLLIIIGFLGWGKYEEHKLDQRNLQTMAAIVEAGKNQQADVIVSKLEEVASYDDDSQARIQADPDVQNAIIGYFTDRIDKQVDIEKGRYNFPTAYDILDQAKTYYPDSGKLAAKEDELNDKKKLALVKQRNEYTRMLKIGPWLNVEGENNDIPDVLAIIKQIDPTNALLSDARTLRSYLGEIRGSRQDGKFDHTEQVIEQAKQYAPNDPALVNEKDELALARFRADRQQELTSLINKVSAANARLGVNQAGSVADELARIHVIAPENALLNEIQTTVSTQLAQAATKATSRDTLSQVQQQYNILAPMLAPEQRNAIMATLDSGWGKLGGLAPELAEARDTRAQEILSQINSQSDRAEFTHEWSLSLRQAVNELEALVGPRHAELQQARRKLAEQHIQKASSAADENRLTLSQQYLAYASSFDTNAPDLAATTQKVKLALDKQEAERLEKERLAIIAALKQDLLTKAEAERIDEAMAFLEELRLYLLSDDRFLTTEGPNAIGDAYARAAMREKQQADELKDYISQRDAYVAALQGIKEGFKIAPSAASLRKAQNEIQHGLTVAETRNTFRTADRLDVTNMATLLERIRSFKPDDFKRLQTEFAEAVANRISTMENYDPQAAKEFLDNAKSLDLDQVLLARIRVAVPPPSKYAQQIVDSIKASNLTEAGKILETALTEESDHPEIKRLRGVLDARVKEAETVYKDYQAAIKGNKVKEARKLIAEAMKIWGDNNEYQTAFNSIKVSIIASKAVCNTRLAGYGRRSRGRCYDMISMKEQGPIMVVLPAGAGNSTPFAISKFEISVADFNNYCQKTQACQPSSANPALPITNITFQQAKDYAAWLSEVTGANYRLPTEDEWVFAASAAGKQPRGKSYNCTLRLGDKIMKGTGLEDVNSGKQNGWGLVNYIGNAQEWVDAPAGIKTRGGAFKDAMQNCTIELERAHDGTADAVTSFRLVRDIS